MRVSIIIPVHNGAAHLRECLTAVAQTHYPIWECIVVNDGSTDCSVEIAQSFTNCRVVHTSHRSGPAIARNLGAARAQGELLFFIDSDVQVQPGTVGHAAAIMQAQPELAACFGSYDDTPSQTNFLSQYRNLQHHYVHQTSPSEASTFWSGCGIMRRQIFNEMGGFHTLTPGRPSIEDIELGYRLRRAGHAIKLENLLQVKHLKRWTLGKVLLTDVRDRAWPWTRLIVQEGDVPNELNLQLSQRLSTVTVFTAVLLSLFSLRQPQLWGFVIILCLLLLYLNRPFYRFFLRQRGWTFTIRAIFLHWFYFLYSGITFGLGLLYWGIMRREMFKDAQPITE